MYKKILATLVIGIVAISTYIYWDYSLNRELLIPYPYSLTPAFDKKFETDNAIEIKEASDAKILIVGDQMGQSLNAHSEMITNQFKDAVTTPPNIYNWSRPKEGLFRTLYKLKKLKKMPPVVIYFGASSELQEKKFEITDRRKILNNFNTYDDEKLISLIITFPWLSKIFYKSVEYLDLDEFNEYENLLSADEKLLEKELTFKIFEYEVKELIDTVKDKKSSLILVTTPLNLTVEPKEICANSSSDDIVELQQEIEADIKLGSYKIAYPKALELASLTPSNARSFYLLGIAALRLGDLKVARENLYKATVFDCANWRGNAVYNAILKKLAKTKFVHLIDFDQFMSSQLLKDGLFNDELTPQNLFYQFMVDELGSLLKKILSVTEN